MRYLLIVAMLAGTVGIVAITIDTIITCLKSDALKKAKP